MNAIHAVVSDDEIAVRAYAIWQSRGCPPGDGEDDWEAAKAELTAARIRRNGNTQERVQSWWRRFRERIAGK
jgi:hypothetical protein